MGLPDKWTELGESDARIDRLHIIGNAVVPATGAKAFVFLFHHLNTVPDEHQLVLPGFAIEGEE